jgi:lysophospholipase L1-like esterase
MTAPALVWLAAASLRIVSFGDSLTAPREGVVTYSDILAAELPARGVQVEVLNRGIRGNTSEMARERFERDVLAAKPDLAIIELGTNDSAVDVWKTPPATAPRVSLERYRANLEYFIETLRKRGAKVILVAPSRLAWTDKLRAQYGKPPYDPNSPDGFNVTLDRYADAVRDLARLEHLPLVDAASIVPVATLPDGMHPNSAGHRALATRLLDVVARELTRHPEKTLP